MNKSVLIGIGVFAILVAIMAYSSMNLTQNRVEVCMAFNGRINCKTARAASKEDALRAARTGACADITAGVTEVLGCERSEPDSVTWLD